MSEAAVEIPDTFTSELKRDGVLGDRSGRRRGSKRCWNQSERDSRCVQAVFSSYPKCSDARATLMDHVRAAKDNCTAELVEVGTHGEKRLSCSWHAHNIVQRAGGANGCDLGYCTRHASNSGNGRGSTSCDGVGSMRQMVGGTRVNNRVERRGQARAS